MKALSLDYWLKCRQSSMILKTLDSLVVLVKPLSIAVLPLAEGLDLAHDLLRRRIEVVAHLLGGLVRYFLDQRTKLLRGSLGSGFYELLGFLIHPLLCTTM